MKDYVDEFKKCKVEDIAEKYIDGDPQISKIAVNPDEPDADNQQISEELSDEQITELRNEDKFHGRRYDILRHTLSGICTE